MKKFTILFLLLFASIFTYAQNQVATLQHNDTITNVFYGANAYSSAYNASVNGDVITLSSGTFNAVNIEKSITIRGAGCLYDSVTQVMPTIISGDFSLRHDCISFEGIWFTGFVYTYQHAYGWTTVTTSNNVNFLKCNINKIGYGGNDYYGNAANWQFVDCIIYEFKSWNQNSWNNNHSFTNMSIINSVVRFITYSHNDIYNPTSIYNSIILFNSTLDINNIMAYNSIIATSSGHDLSNNTFFNCIEIKTGETSLFEGQIAQNVMEVNDYSDVFETFDGNISYDNIYQLNNSIASSFLGNDGTEVGIYGGMIPYKPRPSYMILKSCNVASQTNENKKLSVEMELLGPED